MDAPSTTSEAPLARPPGAFTPDEQFEAPLERPAIPPPEIPFDQCGIFFAVDVSGSTTGPVLAQEIRALETIADHLPNQTRSKCSVGPWSDRAQHVLQLDELDQLHSSGGTAPRVILEDSHQLKAVNDSQLWFLFTDGEIYEHEIRKFAEKIDEHGVHNKACVLIVFGYRAQLPALCNISVGVALFGMSSDAAFLFHDIDTRELFVFQAKGCFSYLCGPGQREVVLENSTPWQALPTTNYEALFMSRVPLPRVLNRNEIVLQDGTRLDLDRITKDNLTTADAGALLENGTDLNSIMVSMRIRGKADDAKRWVHNRKVAITTQDNGRIDVGDQAKSALCEVIDCLQEPDLQIMSKLQSRLRDAHITNWQRLIEDRITEQIRSEMADDCLRRELLADHAPSLGSPVLLTPAASPTYDDIVRVRTERSSSTRPSYYSPEVDTPAASVVTPQASETQSSKSNEDKAKLQPLRQRLRQGVARPHRSKGKADSPASRQNHHDTKGQTELLSPADYLKIETLRKETTFCPGFAIPKNHPLQTLPFLTCPFCGENTVHFAILLKEIPDGTFTDGFPTPKSGCEVLYPLALAPYRETDIVARTSCCEVCAYHLAKSKSSLNGEKIVAALPIVAPLILRENKQKWLNALDEVLDERFERRNLLAIFLAIVTETLEHARRDPTHQYDLLQQVLHHASLELRDECRISFGGRLGTIDQAVQAYFGSNEINFDNGLLMHPIESFAIILANTTMIGRAVKVRILFMRFALLVCGKFAEASDPVSTKTVLASAYLKLLKEDRIAVSRNEFHDYETPPTPRNKSRRAVTISDLIAYSLIATRDLATLKILGPIWQEVEFGTEPALYLCLLKLAHERGKPSSLPKLLERWRTRGGFEEVFMNPTGVTDEMIDGILIMSP